MLTAQRISLILTYLVGLGSFLSLYGIASLHFFLPALVLFILGLPNDLRFRVYLHRWLLNAGGILFTIYSLLGLSLENVIRPFADILLVLLSIKALEQKRERDLYQMLLLSLFGVAVTTTFRLDISFLSFFLYELFAGSVAFLFINASSNLGDRPLPRGFLMGYLRFSLLFPLIVALASVPFFLILPRAQTPFFDLFTKRESGLVSGIAREVEMGKVGEIQQDNRVVMRVYGRVPPDPYWRVSVFDTMVGTKWIRTVEEREGEVRGGFTYRYTVVLEPTYDSFVPLLDYPVRVVKVEGLEDGFRRLKGGFYRSEAPITKPVRYTAVSTDAGPEDPPDPVYLEVPEDVPPSVVSLARRLSEGKGTDGEKLAAVVDFFRRGFSYSLKLEEYEGNPIEHFLFRSKRGNCEYFASSTALILRLMGIPSRVVGGYKGYLRNEFGNYLIVTNSMAHVWVEAFVGGRWVRVDTTPPYFSPALRRISRLDLLRDAIVSFWYENVVGFTAQKQLSLFMNLRRSLSGVNAAAVKDYLKIILSVLLLTFLVFSLIRIYLYRLRRTPENLYRLLISKLERLEGREVKGMLPEEVLSAVRGKPYYGEVKFIVSLYQRHRFSPHRVGREELMEGYRLLRKIH